MKTGTTTPFDRAEMRRRMGRVRGDLVSKHWHARILQILIGIWIGISAFVWNLHGPQRAVAIVGGVLIIVSSVLAGFFDRLRVLVGLSALWTLIAMITVQGAHFASILTTVYATALLTALCMLPYSEASLVQRFGEERRWVV